MICAEKNGTAQTQEQAPLIKAIKTFFFRAAAVFMQHKTSRKTVWAHFPLMLLPWMAPRVSLQY